jgi:hypothetical protein
MHALEWSNQGALSLQKKKLPCRYNNRVGKKRLECEFFFSYEIGIYYY